MSLPSQAVIFCGGRGERLRPLTDSVPKPMAPVLGRPFLEYLIEQLRDAGIREILLLTGYLGETISQHFGDGRHQGVRITYHQGPAEWETGRRLFEARSLLESRLVLMYADNLAPVSFAWLVEHHVAVGQPLTVTLAAKSKGNIRLSASGLIDCYDLSRCQPGLDYVEIGYMLAERDAVLAQQPERGSFSLVLRDLAASGRLAGFSPGCFYHSISDLERLRRTEEYVRPKRVLLIDRDGLINRKASRGEYIWRQDDFVWLEPNVAGLEELAGHGFEFVVISNQAGIGRGMMSQADVDSLHTWMIEQLRQRGIVIRDVFMCPHHWEDNCTCRKPLPGMFFAAAKKYNLRLDRTFYLGDDERDAIAASRAGCPCVLVGAEHVAECDNSPVAAALRCHHMGEAVPSILSAFRDWHTLSMSREALA